MFGVDACIISNQRKRPTAYAFSVITQSKGGYPALFHSDFFQKETNNDYDKYGSGAPRFRVNNKFSNYWLPCLRGIEKETRYRGVVGTTSEQPKKQGPSERANKRANKQTSKQPNKRTSEPNHMRNPSPLPEWISWEFGQFSASCPRVLGRLLGPCRGPKFARLSSQSVLCRWCVPLVAHFSVAEVTVTRSALNYYQSTAPCGLRLLNPVLSTPAYTRDGSPPLPSPSSAHTVDLPSINVPGTLTFSYFCLFNGLFVFCFDVIEKIIENRYLGKKQFCLRFHIFHSSSLYLYGFRSQNGSPQDHICSYFFGFMDSDIFCCFWSIICERAKDEEWLPIRQTLTFVEVTLF